MNDEIKFVGVRRGDSSFIILTSYFIGLPLW